MSFVLGGIFITFSMKVEGGTITSAVDTIVGLITLYYLIKKERREQKQTVLK
ncbi:hypothetical protein EMIT0210MI2_270005 [Priestia megaterium]|uniref:hypothetical protein n=1 Tax=Priestia megaterium TaxID=1404 RepID=UPI002E1FA546|nr:hypothetical protein [Priestia megaterium]